MPRFPLPLALLCLLPIAGCDGCRRVIFPEAEEESTEEDVESLPDFSSAPPAAFPADARPPAGGVKPGHWFTASQSLKSNRSDARGQLQSSATLVTAASGSPPSLEPALASVRPVVLPRGQQRQFDYRLLAPLPDSADKHRIFLNNRLVSSQRGVSHEATSPPLSLLAEAEYFFVVLTTRPERFSRIQVADWVRPFRDDLSMETAEANYRVVIPSTDNLLPLAETMLDWTSTAVVLWDDLPADELTPGQLQALADWVRFGGALIVNGAEASEAVARSPLADLLPSRPTSRVELDVAAADKLLQSWSVPSDRSLETQTELVRDGRARVASEGESDAASAPVPGCSELVLARPVGRGRVVQSRFDLTGDWMVGWESYDSFVNAALLGRPRREFVTSSPAGEPAASQRAASPQDRILRQRYPDLSTDTASAAVNTQFRLTARDAALPAGEPAWYRQQPIAGVGGWSDEADLIVLAREALRAESGIEIPDQSLVIWTLGIYLLLLVPLNYLLFRILGRQEYAWLCVPLIAVGGAVWVARAARLDIGFARSQNEIAVLELQPEYPRGHLSRVVAIYNSLSSRYEVAFDSEDSVAAPLETEPRPEASRPLFRTSQGPGPVLAGFAVASNQVRLLRTEQLIEVGGDIRLEENRLINRSTYDLFDARVIERDLEGHTRVAVVGRCAAGADVPLRHQSGRPRSLASDVPSGLAQLLQQLAAPAALPPGSARLVARIDATLPGMTVTPAASQRSGQTIVLAHLRHPAPDPPRPDVNLVSDFPELQSGDRFEIEIPNESEPDDAPVETAPEETRP